MPGRFRAHARPTSPAPAEARAAAVGREYGIGALAEAPSLVPNRLHGRTRALERTLDALSPDRRRRTDAEDERLGLLRPWLGKDGPAPRLPRPFATTTSDSIAPPPLPRSYTEPGQPFGGALGRPASPGPLDDESDRGLLRPGRRKVDQWMASWWRRWFLLVGTPCIIVCSLFCPSPRVIALTLGRTRRSGFGRPCRFRSRIHIRRNLRGVSFLALLRLTWPDRFGMQICLGRLFRP